ncbi:MAG: helix-turn-helix domain-containing protein [Bdellovibrionales bacterium]|nr:helix-turn-helix domain-containing protein [Bdellovibrionales bacterium]
MSDKPKYNTAEQFEEDLQQGPRQETHYELLKVSPTASVPEIIQAYHQAKAAFTQGSIATYSLFSDEEAQEMLTKLEEAYLTLTNLEKRQVYDARIGRGLIVMDDSPSFSELDLRKKARDAAGAKDTDPNKAGIPISRDVETLDHVDGPILQRAREKIGLTVEEAARITKIPGRYIGAVERDEFNVLPARVYLQGFITNLANLYRLEPKSTVTLYFQHLDKKNPKKLI